MTEERPQSGFVDVEEAADILSTGGVVVYPTETVYGMAASIEDSEAVERVFEVKHRSRNKPLSVAFPSVDEALGWTSPSEAAEEFVREVLPGAVTVLVPNDCVYEEVVAGEDLVGVRVSSHPDVRSLTEIAGPVTSTSANTSGEPAAQSPEEIELRIAEAVDGVMEADEGLAVGSGEASTVVDATTWEVVREGADVERVRRLLEEFSRRDR